MKLSIKNLAFFMRIHGRQFSQVIVQIHSSKTAFVLYILLRTSYIRTIYCFVHDAFVLLSPIVHYESYTLIFSTNSVNVASSVQNHCTNTVNW